MIKARISTCIIVLLLLVGAFFLGGVSARAPQPHMQAALAALRNAKHELILASPNKGGHRQRAIELVDQAIAQVEAGIAYAR